jgi:hypothetical protein
MKLMEGYAESYGTYDAVQYNPDKGGKLEIKATARTVRANVTVELWQDHVDGRRSIGIVPIRDNDTALWGVIDVDTYDLEHVDIVKNIAKHKLPLVVCRSKSGGAHIFLFLKEPVSATLMQARLKEIAATLGYGGSEIFPKQRTVAWERGDCGSWLNMPYFDAEVTDRYGIKDTGLGMSLEEFLVAAEAAQQPASFLEDQEFRKKPAKDPDFGDGPPCIQHLVAMGFPQGTRNNGLFALGTFAKKKYGQRWQERLEDWNRQFMDPPVAAQELIEVIKSLERKEYQYRCRDQPLCAHCNSSLCRTRKFGVGGEDDFPQIDGLSVLDTEPPLWFMNVGDVRLELTTDELQNYRLFHRVCMEKLFTCYRMMKHDDWLRIVATAMKDAVRIDAPREVSRTGQFQDHLEDFLTQRHRGEMRDDLLVGRPWLDPESNQHYFRLRDLKKHLEQANFKDYSDAQIITRIREMGGDKKVFNLKGRCVNTWSLPEGSFSEAPVLDLPSLEDEPI